MARPRRPSVTSALDRPDMAAAPAPAPDPHEAVPRGPSGSSGKARGRRRLTLDLDNEEYQILREWRHSADLHMLDLIRALTRLAHDDPSLRVRAETLAKDLTRREL